MKTIHALFTLEKETKGSFRFQEIDQTTGLPLMKSGGDYKIGSLYIRKSALTLGEGSAPRRIIVTVEGDDA